MVGFVEIGPHGEGPDPQTRARRRAGSLQQLVLTIEQRCLQSDVAKPSEAAETICGQVGSQEKIVVGCREAHTPSRLVVRFTAQIFLILQQAAAARQMQRVAPTRKTLHGSMLAAALLVVCACD
jgi:hypothetical protein